MANYGTSFSENLEALIEKLKKWFFDESCPEVLNILITGKTGVGKSRLVNALVGRKVAEEGHAKDPCTSKVTSYQVDIQGVVVTVWDSPGLQDGTTNEDSYIQDMREKIKDVALMIYCIKMDDTRFYEEDKKAIRTLTEEFGEELWVNTVVALTRANRVEDPDGEDELEFFQGQLEEWKRQFTDYLEGVGPDQQICKSIPVIPVGNLKKSMGLPGRENWLSYLWIECFQVMKASARRGMYKINRHRLVKSSSDTQNTVPEDGIPSKIPLNEEQQKSFMESISHSFVTSCKGVGEGAGAIVGGAVGGAVGGVSGFVAGAWRSLCSGIFD